MLFRSVCESYSLSDKYFPFIVLTASYFSESSFWLYISHAMFFNFRKPFSDMYRNRIHFCKKAKWLYEEAVQIAVKRGEVKSKGEKERHAHLNAEFQRIAGRDKKGFLSDQCKEIEENNRMTKTRDLFKKIRDTREHFMQQRWAQ